MAQVYGAGGKTLPKRGKNGTGSYWPDGTPKYFHKGNVFPGIKVQRPSFPEIRFGETSRASISTIAGRNAVATLAIHPNKATYNTGTNNLAPATIQSSTVEGNNLQPVKPSDAKLQMPHERNTNSAPGVHKKPNTYRTAFGGGVTMPSDTAFERDTTGTYKRMAKPKATDAVEAVKKSASVRTFARQNKPLPVSGGLTKSANPRTPPASFASYGQHWQDPHNSFVKGATTIAGRGVGRWDTIKTGVIPTTKRTA